MHIQGDGMTRKIAIFDTTLRDGEQSPGASMNAQEKIVITRQLLRLGVDVVEAGFPVSSPGEFKSVQDIAKIVGDKCIVCGLTRAVEHDIDVCAEALAVAKRPRIHTGIGVSPEHLAYKFKGITLEEAIDRGVAAVRHAKRYVEDVEFYAEDAGRAAYEDLAKMMQAVIKAGATLLNIPDTTGYSMPHEFGKRIEYLMEHVDGIEDVCVSVHCHNDLGMATALSLAGVRAGATQVECTVNGLGERAGNAAMEEVVMAIKMHGGELDAHTDINAQELSRASRLVSSISGMSVQPNKAIVGANAFAHSSGIHQDGVLKNRSTYEIVFPEDVGAAGSQIVLTARSGHAALRKRFEDLGYTDIPDQKFEQIHAAFLELADQKSNIYDEDLLSLIDEHDRNENAIYKLDAVQISCGQTLVPTATVTMTDAQGNTHTVCEMGVGPIDAMYSAINKVVKAENDLMEYSVQSVTRGIDALGEVTVRIMAPDGSIFTGRGSDNDITVSSGRAYVNAINRMLEQQAAETLAPADENGDIPPHI
jgi:2-isopropylmalate synthase